MEGRAVGHNIEKEPRNDHPLVLLFSLKSDLFIDWSVASIE
jgi:hypothetical protein